ncbi:MAG: polysaccharide biosynthesis tyrosine autokinase [Rikenellaceae bacterium]
MITLRTLYDHLIKNIKLFTICIAICLAAGLVYLHITPATYLRQASIIIKDVDVDITQMALSSAGITKTSNNLTNEIYTLSTPPLMERVVDHLSLNVSIHERLSPFRQIELYQISPLKITLCDHFEGSRVEFDLLTESERGFSLRDITINNHKQPNIEGSYGLAIELDGGLLVIEKVTEIKKGRLFHYKKQFATSTALNYLSRLKITQRSPSSSIIDLSLASTTPHKAEDILNTLIKVYNESWYTERELTNSLSTDFINKRLSKIESELKSVDQLISNYKSDNLIPDIGSATAFNLQNSSESTLQLMQIENQLAIVKYIQRHTESRTRSNDYLPNYISLGSPTITKLIDNYNQLVRRAATLQTSSTTSNPIIATINEQIDQQRQLLQLSIKELLTSLTIQSQNYKRELEQSNQELSSKPAQELFLLNTDRQRSIKERLYLFLLQKREESELNSAFIPSYSKVIEYAAGSSHPIDHSAPLTLMIAFALGIAAPAGYLFARESIDSTVRSVKDIESLNIPIIGSIPLINTKVENKIIVNANDRTAVNEAFRVVRSNLDFILDSTSNKVLQTISLLPNSGKSLITANLSMCMALREQRILMIDGDIRKSTLSRYSKRGVQGLSSYLSGKCSDLEQIIIKGEHHPLLDIIPAGLIPPNPAELLLSSRLHTLISTLREQYDYILIDSPPVEILPDASIIAQHCDASLFVIRAGALDKRLLPEIEDISQSGKYPSISLLLNASTQRSKGYGYYSS